MSENRTIRVEALTRVEGEGGLHVRLNGDIVEDLGTLEYLKARIIRAHFGDEYE